MSRIALVGIVTALLTALVVAQAPEPPKAMSRLDRVLGHWKNEGTARFNGADGPEAKWTSVSHSRKVMGGHFIREDLIVTFEDMPAKLAFIQFYTWDAIAKRYLVYVVNNMGELKVQELDWLSDNTTSLVATSLQQGQRFLERWVTRIGDGEISFVGEMSATQGSWWQHVRGKGKRVKTANPISFDGIGPYGVAPAPEMRKACRMAGSYDVAGSYGMDPDQEHTAFSGTERIFSLFGGLVLANQARGDGYEGWGFMVWSARHQKYRRFGLTSGGVAEESGCHAVDDDQFVYLANAAIMGSPTISQTVLECDEKGKPCRSRTYATTGASEPFLSSTATYEPRVGR